jgi:Ca2+:H+ antiporter
MNIPTAFAREERFLVVTVATCAIFLGMHDSLLGGLGSRAWLMVVFIWLFVVILGAALAVLRHAERLAHHLGEPVGTLVLTIAVTSIEIMSISAVMLHGENNPTLARDTLFSVTMIVLNGMVGVSLLWGGWKHREQAYNLQGANAYLGLIIPLGVLGLVLPRFTNVAEGSPLPFGHQIFLVVTMLTLYATFLGLQTKRLKGYFTTDASTARHGDAEVSTRRGPVASAVLLIAYMVPVVFLVDQLAVPVDYVVETLKAPAAVGGLTMAILVALPEGLGAIRAASRNDLQRAVNIFLGSVLSTIGLTIPAILLIGQMTHHPVILGLEHTDLVLFVLTLVLSLLTFSSVRTHLLQGAVHLTLFVCFVYFLFSP